MGDGDPVDAVEIGSTTTVSSDCCFKLVAKLTNGLLLAAGAALAMGSVTPVKPLVSVHSTSATPASPHLGCNTQMHAIRSAHVQGVLAMIDEGEAFVLKALALMPSHYF